MVLTLSWGRRAVGREEREPLGAGAAALVSVVSFMGAKAPRKISAHALRALMKSARLGPACRVTHHTRMRGSKVFLRRVQLLVAQSVPAAQRVVHALCAVALGLCSAPLAPKEVLLCNGQQSSGTVWGAVQCRCGLISDSGRLDVGRDTYRDRCGEHARRLKRRRSDDQDKENCDPTGT